MKTLCLVLLLLSLNRASFSQSEDLRVERISLENGVSNDLIFSIFQDSKGFVWFGTMFGLVRYDGMNYKTYRFDPLDSNSLSNDDVISICEDRNGNLWFGTYNGGVTKYERSENKFTRYLSDPGNENSISNNTVWAIKQDKDGIMWFATEGGGLNRFENGKFTAYKRDTTGNSGSISGNYIRSIETDKAGNIWAGTLGTGLNKFDKEKNVFINYRNDSNDAGSISNNFIASVFEDSNGNLWIGTGGGGLNKFEPSTGKFKRYKNDSADANSISSNFVFSIAEESPGVFLLGTQKGLNKFNAASEKFEKISIDPKDKLKKESIIAFIKDKSGVLWLSSYNDGLYKISYPPEKFRSFLVKENIKCIYEDKSGRLWAGTEENGLQMSVDKGKTFVSIPIKNENKNNQASISINKVNSVAEDIEGNIWAGTGKGLYKLDKNGVVTIQFVNDIKNDSSLISNNVLKVLFDKSGTLWAGTDNGLDRLDQIRQTFKHFQNSEEDTNSLSENTILSIYEDKYNDLWIGTYFGLNKLDRNSGKFVHYKKNPNDQKSLSNNYVFSFCEDENNNFWIGTGGGLNVFDRKTGTFFNFTEREGLPNAVIAGLESSNDGYLWISTFKGVSRYSIKDKAFKNYDTYDGLLSNMFNTGSYYKNTKGEIYFGSIDGVSYFDPSKIQESNFISNVMLTSLIKYDDKNKKEIDISAKDEVELSYKDNIINIGFSSADFTNPHKNKFAYRLEGFENEWNSSEDKNEAIYTNLNPGEYVFKVRGTNSDGVWNKEEASLKIKITPPFWKTLWFYGILICTIIGGIILIQNYRVRQKVKNLIELEKIKEKERELMREQASRDYHDELGHKLTRISLYSRRINKKLRPTANGLTEDLNSIVETSNSLQSGAKDLIWAMNPKEDTLYDFTVRLRDFGNDLFENTGINFSSDGISNEFKDIFLSMNCKRHLIYIFKEGMNNILKYSRCANVRLTFQMYDDDIEIVLSDDGKGFDINNCPKGYGLKNIFSRAKQINVNVNILSEDRKGTVIKLKARLQDLISV